jgi:hypothetical protein
MTDTEILQWLIEHNAVDTVMLTFMKMANDSQVAEVRNRLEDLLPEES